MRAPVVTLLAVCVLTSLARGYPLDAAEETGIQRLEAARLAQEGALPGRRLPRGALLSSEAIQLRLADRPELERPVPDASFAQSLTALLGDEAPLYGLAVLDLSDPARPLYGEHRADAPFNPGSVGKLVVALGVLQALADVYPDDVERRREILRKTEVRADEFIQIASHEVPIWRPGEPRVVRRKLQVGDTANLWTYMDWMLSASSNSAASMVIQQLLLLKNFGVDYPASAERSGAFLSETPKMQLSRTLTDVLQTPVTRNGLDVATLRQGGFFTSEAKRMIPGAGSTVTARALIDFLVRMEQGRLVDRFSSTELKRLLYLTDRRIRYASAYVLDSAAVYFKSGSLYRCKPEPDFVCHKYQGNLENMLNSVAIVESPAGDPHLYYMVALTSNVLRKNSAVEHQRLAMHIHRLIEARHAPRPAPSTGD